jgi:hypothetical protein
MLALFEPYPLLKKKLPYIALGDFPTPVERLDRIDQAINVPALFVKRISGNCPRTFITILRMDRQERPSVTTERAMPWALE